MGLVCNKPLIKLLQCIETYLLMSLCSAKMQPVLVGSCS